MNDDADLGLLPLEYIGEYDGAAEHYARTGRLPDNMGVPGAIEWIQWDQESFQARVKDFRYAIAMQVIFGDE